MADGETIVVDANVLLNLATPVVDGRSRAPSGDDPLRALLTAYDVHTPSKVLGEVGAATDGDDLLAAAADTMLLASDHLTVHDTGAGSNQLELGLDPGESHAIRLANHLDAAMLVTDEFNSTNYLFVALALDDRNTLFTTPHVLCSLAANGVLDPGYVDAVLTYYVETKDWDQAYVEQLRSEYLH